MRDKVRKRYQRKLKQKLRIINKNIEQDDLWLGRFILFQKEAEMNRFPDGSGAILYVVLRAYDKKTHYYYDFNLEYNPDWRFVDYDLFQIINGFIVDKLDVWREDPPKNIADYRNVKVDIDALGKLPYNFYLSYANWPLIKED